MIPLIMNRIPKGNVGLVHDNNIPKLLPEGTHYISSNTFNYIKTESLNQAVIKHGTLTRFRVKKGGKISVDEILTVNRSRIGLGKQCSSIFSRGNLRKRFSQLHL